MELTTSRLKLRRWRDEDLEPFAALNADPEVMRHFPGTLTRRDSDDFVAAIERGFASEGLGLWAVEVVESGEFAGYVGLWRPRFEAHFTPAVEIGWRLARAHWGYGIATEAGRECLRDAFERLRLDEIVSFTVPQNDRSRRVMERLGLTHDESDDFDHPRFPDDERLRRHVLYRIDRGRWESINAS